MLVSADGKTSNFPLNWHVAMLVAWHVLFQWLFPRQLLALSIYVIHLASYTNEKLP